MTKASRTLNPLHFEDLDPRRFEDLAKQLLYDFRPWQQLEATGKLGTDDGFDVRGLERITSEPDEIDAEETRTWLIQCKRERVIGPLKLARYLRDIANVAPTLDGIIFIAACDFSKRCFDDIRAWSRSQGISEVYLWGKSALEDMLLQPKNDHLLFSYFGFSASIRTRSRKTALSAALTNKRKIKRILEDHTSVYVLIRSIKDKTYPYAGDAAIRLWQIIQPREITHLGLSFQHKRCFAFFAEDGVSWDVANAHNDEEIASWENPWSDPRSIDRCALFDVWRQLPENERAWLNVIGFLSFEDIVAIDDIGDDVCEYPHFYVNWPSSLEFFPCKQSVELETVNASPKRKTQFPALEARVERFPSEYRKIISE